MRHRQPACSYQLRSKERTVHQGLLSRTAGTGLCPLRGNFIGETLKIADKLKLPRVTLGVMIGKAVKLAEGHLDTHSKKVTMNKEFIQDIAHRTGCNEDVLTAIRNMNLARELWDIIPAEKLETFSKLLTEHCKQCCAPLLPDGELTILLISEDGKIYV